MKVRIAAVFVAVSAVTGIYYHWGVRAAGNDFRWKSDLGGYYNRQARGFVEGHLYMPVEVDPRLLALPNPLDPKAGNDLPKLFDAVLYDKHYYLYHGAAPSVMLFVPWLLITRHDLPENYALFLFVFGAYLCLAGALFTFLRMARVEITPGVLAIALLALGFCSSVPFLLSRIWVYEIAIGSGYFCIAAGLFFLARSAQSPHRIWPAAAGLMFGLAVGCRPPLIIASGFAMLAAWLLLRRRAVPFAAAFAFCGLLIALYNFERFGNPLEFGLRYQITGPYQGLVRPRMENVLPGIYFLLFTRPVFSPVFPWVLMAFPPREFPRPPEYFIEPIIGAMFLAPFMPLALASALLSGLRRIGWVPLASGIVILLFLTTTGLSTQRYEVDFLPWLVLAAVAVFMVLAARTRGALRRALIAGMSLAVLFGVVVNLAIGIAGPYDEMMKLKPLRYVRIAQWFSPLERFRPVIELPFTVDVTHPVRTQPDHYRENLVSAGRPQAEYELFLDHLDGKTVLISRFAGVDVIRELEPSAAPVHFHVQYSRDTHEVIVSANGAELVRQNAPNLITAPAQIRAAS